MVKAISLYCLPLSGQPLSLYGCERPSRRALGTFMEQYAVLFLTRRTVGSAALRYVTTLHSERHPSPALVRFAAASKRNYRCKDYRAEEMADSGHLCAKLERKMFPPQCSVGVARALVAALFRLLATIRIPSRCYRSPFRSFGGCCDSESALSRRMDAQMNLLSPRATCFTCSRWPCCLYVRENTKDQAR